MTDGRWSRARLAAAALCVMLGAPAAWASGPSGGTSGSPFGDGFALNVGAMVMVAPRYEGASDYRVIGLPFIAPAGLGGGRVQINGPDDVRLRVLELGGLELGPLAGWRFGRDDSDAARLRGLGDVDGGLIVGGYVAYRMGFLKPFLSYHHQVTGDETGGVLRFGTEARWEWPGGVELKGTLGASYADQHYMDAYFGVSPVQAAQSLAGLAPFDAGAGIKDVYLESSARIPLNDLWSVRVTGRYTQLVGEATDSPIVASEQQWMGGLGLIYRWQVR